MYGDTNLGATDDAVILFLKSPSNKAIFEALKRHVYPEYALHFDNQTTEASDQDEVKEPDENPSKGRGRKS